MPSAYTGDGRVCLCCSVLQSTIVLPALTPTQVPGHAVIKLRCGVWHRETKTGKPYESISVSPEKGAEFKEDDLATPHTAAAKPPLVATTVVADDEEI